jgi:predicted deacylase
MTAGYLGLQGVIQQAEGLVRDAGGRFEPIGASVLGRPIFAGYLPGEEPGVLVVAGLHGLEWIGVEVALELLRGLARSPMGCALTVVPVANPDGVAEVERRRGRGSLQALRTNARGVDLNRNFPRPRGGPWHPRWPLPFSGSARVGAATYRGPAALSEPESAALAALLDQRPIAAAASLHSFMGTLIPPRFTSAEQVAEARSLAEVFRRAGGGPYRVLGSRWVDTFTGEWEDYLFHLRGVRAVCVESYGWWESARARWVAPTLFQRFNPPDPGEVAKRDARGVRAWLSHARSLPPLGAKRLGFGGS